MARIFSSFAVGTIIGMSFPYLSLSPHTRPIIRDGSTLAVSASIRLNNLPRQVCRARSVRLLPHTDPALNLFSRIHTHIHIRIHIHNHV
jgi:hypothetical protein